MPGTLRTPYPTSSPLSPPKNTLPPHSHPPKAINIQNALKPFRQATPCDITTPRVVLPLRWDDIYAPFEFRCFVQRGQMTAIVQYYEVCFSPELLKNKVGPGPTDRTPQ